MAGQQTDRIGYGLLFPFIREASDFSAGTGSTLLKSCVRKTVNTVAFGFGGKLGGEYPWRLDFGSWIHYVRHSNFFNIQGRGDLAQVYIADAIETWEPRVAVSTDKMDSGTSDTDRTKLQVKVYFGLVDETVGDLAVGDYVQPYHEVTL